MPFTSGSISRKLQSAAKEEKMKIRVCALSVGQFNIHGVTCGSQYAEIDLVKVGQPGLDTINLHRGINIGIHPEDAEAFDSYEPDPFADREAEVVSLESLIDAYDEEIKRLKATAEKAKADLKQAKQALTAEKTKADADHRAKAKALADAAKTDSAAHDQGAE
jgi:regulator of protease activity HflC (stomatin/prohibitin superfamily)